MLEGTCFQRLIPEQGKATENPSKVKKILFCSGKVYYELVKEREKMNYEERIAIARVEQVYTAYLYQQWNKVTNLDNLGQMFFGQTF